MTRSIKWKLAAALFPILVIFHWTGTDQLLAMTLDDLDASRRVDWRAAGYPGKIPTITENVINVMELGVVADGTTDDHAVIQAAVNDADAPAVIYFPAGTYRIESVIHLKSGVVLRGAGSDATHLEFLSDNGCIQISGDDVGNYRPITHGLAKGTRQIRVSDVSGFQIGQGGEIRQEDIEAVDPAGEWREHPDWAPTHSVGQMVKIVAIDSDNKQLTIDPPLHLDFDPSVNPEIIPITYQQQIGIEDLTIRRLDTGTISSNINITRASDCWFRRIESDQTQRYHFSISQSLHLEIRACYIHDAFHKGNGGRGYGTSLGKYVTSVLVEDNIFSDLRHAMIIQQGTNGCVFGYNYAQRNYSDDGWDKTYISVHGHYPYMNLFEGNIVGYAGLADYWGASGPGNTLFRNRMIGTDKHEEFGPYRGISVDDYSHRQNIIGNELIGSQTNITFDGNTDSASGTSHDVLVHGNNVHGTIDWDPNFADHSLPASFYLSEKPMFFDQLPWPSMGPDQAIDTGTIPALMRFNSLAYVPQPADGQNDGDNPDDGNDGDIPDNGDGGGNQDGTGSTGSDSGGGGCFFTTMK